MLCMCEVKDQAADMFLGRRVLIMLKVKQIPNLISFCEAEALEAQTRFLSLGSQHVCGC